MLSYLFVLALLAPSAFATAGIRQCTLNCQLEVWTNFSINFLTFVLGPGGHRLPQTITIDGCAQTPCDVTQGTDVLKIADFSHPTTASSLRPQVFATALGTTIEYVLPPNQREACDHLSTGSCPLAPNEAATYRFVFPITSIYPPIPVSVELTLRDQASNVVFCAIIDIHVRLRQN